ncbi:Teichoic acids export ATP-binding protein TagH [Stieleria maiorica]|uniref:Teichoic acids export ATP-binding protein TagH n=1 Tax=Stieleria maiorica TaxID=2795974 RepID=A0A5B9MHM0_9BACT|nr:ABC transporter ATP-binding protein [Stieleria maiorica]QEF99490.1 Teichoic acids export ATP-binding protein TagH [Stieleria maiorica]
MTHCIKIENLAKRYHLGLTHAGSIRDLANRVARRMVGRTEIHAESQHVDPERVEDGHFWALRDIGFTVNEGEVVGIIGKNGAGKSTLLKLLSRITLPTEGRVELVGRVASLLEVGTGFHPELTGRENVFLNGTILGMTRREIERQLDPIVEFAGVGKFLDTPVKRYSSGMTVRLGFAVAAHLDPEILIVDEVLAVGDIEFQNRCIGKMKSVAESGKTVLFVSHNLASIRTLTTRAIVLSAGRMVYDGPTAEGVTRYVAENMIVDTSSESIADAKRTLSGLDQKLRFVDLKLHGGDGQRTLPDDGTFRISVKVQANSACDEFVIGMTVYSQDKTAIGSCFSEPLTAPEHGRCRTYELCARFPLAPGSYHCGISMSSLRSAGRELHDSLADVIPFEISAGSMDQDRLTGQWSAAWGYYRLEDLKTVVS